MTLITIQEAAKIMGTNRTTLYGRIHSSVGYHFPSPACKNGQTLTYRPSVNNGYTPLYTSPPKRKPLGEQFISVANQSSLEMTRLAFRQGVRFAEKAHDIGDKK